MQSATELPSAQMTFGIGSYKLRFMLDVRRMRVLREVAARGSFSAAAEALSYTQSAVSQQIAALEREAGTRLVEHADVILARLADAESELEAIAGMRGGRLRLCSFASAGATIMPPAIARFRERHPAVELSLDLAEPDDGVAKLRSGEADIALTIVAPGWPSYDAVDELHLLDDPMYVALPASHPQARVPRLDLGDLAEEPWMLGSTSTCPDTAVFLRACQAAGFEPRMAFQSIDYLAIQGFVAAGVGVSFIPDLALVTVRDDIVIRSLGPTPPIRRIMAATLEGSYCAPARQAMLDILAEVGREFAGGRRELALAS